ncbi:hypothetical protein BOX15_Mlig017678g1 [Macrostomum lignano]|uniref:PID domain-containing protein n=1 Tax=Macrostomum lignano TaxID=282301 RepID=A0A267FHQ9_9PLAT|nr:hypothetical protein BOX15_Mlig017678g1 [Macrostomum lignano]
MSASESESRFEGEGQEFHAKYMGSVEVAKSKGQEICQEAMQKLLVTLKSRKDPKPRLIINLSFEGTRLKEMPPGINLLDLTFKHSQVSYVWKDPRDQRSLGIVRTEPDPDDSTKTVHRFHGIRTIKPAMPFLQEMQELFRIVKERSAQQKEEQAASTSAATAESAEPTGTESKPAEQSSAQQQDARDRATSNLLGPDIPASAMPKNESAASLDDLGDIFSSSVTVSQQPASSAFNSPSGAFTSTSSAFNSTSSAFNSTSSAFNSTSSAFGANNSNSFNPFGQPVASASNPFSQQQPQPAMMPMSGGPGVMSYGFGQNPQYQQFPQQQQQFPPVQFPQQQQQFPPVQFPQQQQQFPPAQFPQQQQYNPYQQQLPTGAPSGSTNPFAAGGGGASLFDRQNSVPSGGGPDLLTPVSLNPAATAAKPNPVIKPDAFSDLVVGLTPDSALNSNDPGRQQLSSKELFKPVEKPKSTLRDLANQSPRP